MSVFATLKRWGLIDRLWYGEFSVFLQVMVVAILLRAIGYVAHIAFGWKIFETYRAFLWASVIVFSTVLENMDSEGET